jgi:hypothetical protein
MPQVPLVDVEKIVAAIDQLGKDLEPRQIEFIKSRWLHQVEYWDQRSRGARWKYFGLRGIMVLGGVSIPVILSVGPDFLGSRTATIIASVVSAIVAAAAAWEGVANYGQIWLEKRRAAEILKCEGWLFIQRADKYAGQTFQIAAALFAAEVERQIAKEVGEYVANFDVDAATARVKQTQQMLDAAGIKPSQGGGAPTARG